MRPSLRFLALVVVGWAGIRAALHGVLPGAEMFSIERSQAKPPPVAATEFPPVEPIAPAPEFLPKVLPYYASAQGAPFPIRPIAVPVYYVSAPAVPPVPRTTILPEPRRD